MKKRTEIKWYDTLGFVNNIRALANDLENMKGFDEWLDYDILVETTKIHTALTNIEVALIEYERR